MSGRLHTYRVSVSWTGNQGRGTESYAAYDRDYVICATGKPPIQGSSDPAFRGDSARWNPEELLLAAISACHKLWYLHLCANAGISVLAYADDAEATMREASDGSGGFVGAVLRPRIALRQGDDVARAMRLHGEAHRFCFIANAVRFPVTCEPEITADP